MLCAVLILLNKLDRCLYYFNKYGRSDLEKLFFFNYPVCSSGPSSAAISPILCPQCLRSTSAKRTHLYQSYVDLFILLQISQCSRYFPSSKRHPWSKHMHFVDEIIQVFCRTSLNLQAKKTCSHAITNIKIMCSFSKYDNDHETNIPYWYKQQNSTIEYFLFIPLLVKRCSRLLAWKIVRLCFIRVTVCKNMQLNICSRLLYVHALPSSKTICLRDLYSFLQLWPTLYG